MCCLFYRAIWRKWEFLHLLRDISDICSGTILFSHMEVQKLGNKAHGQAWRATKGEGSRVIGHHRIVDTYIIRRGMHTLHCIAGESEDRKSGFGVSERKQGKYWGNRVLPLFDVQWPCFLAMLVALDLTLVSETLGRRYLHKKLAAGISDQDTPIPPTSPKAPFYQ